jgi:adenosylcobinamide hydrolase
MPVGDLTRQAVHRADGVAQLRAPGYRWVSTGHPGGLRTADAAYNISVPEGFSRTDLRSYIDTRRARAGFVADGFALLTGVDMRHARLARTAETTVIATAGVSKSPRGGTVNLLISVDGQLTDAALFNLIAVAAEAKAATLLRSTAAPGTSSDAIIIGCAPRGASVRFSGSVTPVGAAVRACVRDAIAASLRSRYGSGPPPHGGDAAHGSTTSVRPTVAPLRLMDPPDGDGP